MRKLVRVFTLLFALGSLLALSDSANAALIISINPSEPKVNDEATISVNVDECEVGVGVKQIWEVRLPGADSSGTLPGTGTSIKYKFAEAKLYTIDVTQICTTSGGRETGRQKSSLSVTPNPATVQTDPPASVVSGELGFTWLPANPWPNRTVELATTGGCNQPTKNEWVMVKPAGFKIAADSVHGIATTAQFLPTEEGEYIVKLTQTCTGRAPVSVQKSILVKGQSSGDDGSSANAGQCAALPADFGAALAEFAKQAGEVFSKKEIDSINDLAEKSGLASALLTIGKGSASALQAADAFARYAKQSENLNIEQFLKDLSTVKVAFDTGDVTTVILTAPSLTGKMGAFMDFLKAAMDSGVAITDLLNVHWPAIKAELDKIRADYPDVAQQLEEILSQNESFDAWVNKIRDLGIASIMSAATNFTGAALAVVVNGADWSQAAGQALGQTINTMVVGGTKFICETPALLAMAAVELVADAAPIVSGLDIGSAPANIEARTNQIKIVVGIHATDNGKKGTDDGGSSTRTEAPSLNLLALNVARAAVGPPSMTWSPNPAVINQSVAFTANQMDCGGAVAKRQWRVNEVPVKDTGNNRSFVYTFTKPGDYSVILDAWCEGKLSEKQSVNEYVPVASAAGNVLPDDPDQGGTADAGNGGIGAMSFTWSPSPAVINQATTFTANRFNCGNFGTARRQWRLSSASMASTVIGDTKNNPAITYSFTKPGDYSLILDGWCEGKLEGKRSVNNYVEVASAVGDVGPDEPSKPIQTDNAFSWTPVQPQAGQKVSFTSQRRDCGLGDSVTRIWEVLLPDHGIEFAKTFNNINAEYTFKVPGQYGVQLSEWCTNKKDQTFTEAQNRIVVLSATDSKNVAGTTDTFTWSPREPQTGEQVWFTSRPLDCPGTSTVRTWRVTGPDGRAKVIAEGTHNQLTVGYAFYEPGKYSVSLELWCHLSFNHKTYKHDVTVTGEPGDDGSGDTGQPGDGSPGSGTGTGNNPWRDAAKVDADLAAVEQKAIYVKPMYLNVAPEVDENEIRFANDAAKQAYELYYSQNPGRAQTLNSKLASMANNREPLDAMRQLLDRLVPETAWCLPQGTAWPQCLGQQRSAGVPLSRLAGDALKVKGGSVDRTWRIASCVLSSWPDSLIDPTPRPSSGFQGPMPDQMGFQIDMTKLAGFCGYSALQNDPLSIPSDFFYEISGLADKLGIVAKFESQIQTRTLQEWAAGSAPTDTRLVNFVTAAREFGATEPDFEALSKLTGLSTNTWGQLLTRTVQGIISHVIAAATAQSVVTVASLFEPIINETGYRTATWTLATLPDTLDRIATRLDRGLTALDAFLMAEAPIDLPDLAQPDPYTDPATGKQYPDGLAGAVERLKDVLKVGGALIGRPVACQIIIGANGTTKQFDECEALYDFGTGQTTWLFDDFINEARAQGANTARVDVKACGDSLPFCGKSYGVFNLDSGEMIEGDLPTPEEVAESIRRGRGEDTSRTPETDENGNPVDRVTGLPVPSAEECQPIVDRYDANKSGDLSDEELMSKPIVDWVKSGSANADEEILKIIACRNGGRINNLQYDFNADGAFNEVDCTLVAKEIDSANTAFDKFDLDSNGKLDFGDPQRCLFYLDQTSVAGFYNNKDNKGKSSGDSDSESATDGQKNSACREVAPQQAFSWLTNYKPQGYWCGNYCSRDIIVTGSLAFDSTRFSTGNDASNYQDLGMNYIKPNADQLTQELVCYILDKKPTAVAVLANTQIGTGLPDLSTYTNQYYWDIAGVTSQEVKTYFNEWVLTKERLAPVASVLYTSHQEEQINPGFEGPMKQKIESDNVHALDFMAGSAFRVDSTEQLGLVRRVLVGAEVQL